MPPVSHPAVAGSPDAEDAHADLFRRLLCRSGDTSKYASVLPDTRKVVKAARYITSTSQFP